MYNLVYEVSALSKTDSSFRIQAMGEERDEMKKGCEFGSSVDFTIDTKVYIGFGICGLALLVVYGL